MTRSNMPDADAGASRQDYSNKSSEKEIGSQKLDMIKAGGPSNDTGITGSSRSYPKNAKVNMDAGRFNPMNDKHNGYGIDGVGAGEK